jgi:hypothetical protein
MIRAVQLPGSTNTIGVGVAIAVTYVLLNNRREESK